MSIRRLSGRALLAASAAVLANLAAPASAQRVDTVVAFGDSYADTGNLFAILGFNPAPQVYPTGRFSGGTNYVDTLAQILNADLEDFAIGGANTDNTNINGPGIPGFVTEWNAYLAGGGGVFPTVPGTFDSGDLVTLSIGGNDARAYQQGGGTLAGAPAAAQASAAYAKAGIDALVDAGAQNISFLYGNTAILPEIANDPSAQAVRNAFSTTFAAAMQPVLAGYAADGVTVHYLDLSLVGQRIAADPAAFGLTSAGPCAPAPQCIGDSAYTNQFLFYVDNLHLTSAGFAIVAHYIATQLEAPLTLQSPSDMSLETAKQFSRSMELRLEAADYHAAPGLHFFINGDAFSRNVEWTETNDPFDIDGYGVTAGAEVGLGEGIAGVAVNYSRPRVRFGNDAASENADSYQAGAYAGIDAGPLFASAQVGYGSDKHHLSRMGVIDSMTADPGGEHFLAGAKVGYLMPAGPLRIGPVAGLDYAKVDIDAYTEDGDAALTLNVEKQSFESLSGTFGLEARGSVKAAGSGFSPYAQALLETDLSGDSRIVHYAQTDAPTIVNSVEYPGSKKIFGRINVGARASLLGAVSVEAAISKSIERPDGDDLSAHLGFSFGF